VIMPDMSVEMAKNLAKDGLKFLEGRVGNDAEILRYIFQQQLSVLSTPWERQQELRKIISGKKD
jgi:hypothetical protein